MGCGVWGVGCVAPTVAKAACMPGGWPFFCSERRFPAVQASTIILEEWEDCGALFFVGFLICVVFLSEMANTASVSTELSTRLSTYGQPIQPQALGSRIVALINARFAGGRPSNDLALAGVLMRGFDGMVHMMDPSQPPWTPDQSYRSGTTSDRWSCSLSSSQAHTTPYLHHTTPNFCA